MSVYGKVALVTGGASGLGLALVQELLKNGAKGVSIVDSSKTNGLDALDKISEIFGKDRVIFNQANVTQEEELKNAYDKTVEVFHNLDIVVNNAGIVDEINWEKSLNILLVATIRSTYLAMEHYFPKYKSGDEGIIINTSSIGGLDPHEALPVYCLSKRGVIVLGQALGTENYYTKYKSKILTVCPGVIKTPLLNNVLDKFGSLRKGTFENHPGLQRPEFVAQKYISIMDKGQNGSVWVVEDEEPEYEVVIPGRKDMKK